MKDITLKITGKQCFKDKEEEQLQFVTDGQIYSRNGALYVVYDESDLSGLKGSKTTLKVLGETVKMKRIGEAGYGTELYFETGKRFNSTYDTPYGSMVVEVLTNSVLNHLNPEDMTGTVDIEYNISLEGVAEGKNKLTIDVM